MRHLCLAVVPLDRLSRLVDLDPSTYQWVSATTWAEATDLVRTQPIEIGVIDPMLGDKPSVEAVEQLRVHFPSLPLLLYCALAPTAAAVLLKLGRSGIRRVIFARFEDAPANLRRAIAKELEYTALQQVLRSLDEYLQGLPRIVRSALEISLHAPSDRSSTELLAGHAGLSRRECHESFIQARLPVPRVVIVLIRLLYAHRLLLDPGHTIDDVAQKLGYAKARTLQGHLRTVFGMTAGELRQVVDPATATDLVIRRYFLAPSQSEASDLMAISG